MIGAFNGLSFSSVKQECTQIVISLKFDWDNLHFIQSGKFSFKPLARKGEVMRNAYHQYIKQQMVEVRQENPTMTGREVLKKVREA